MNQPVTVEPDAHVGARHFRTGVRFLLALSLVATVICLLFFRPAAYLAAIPIPVLYAVLVATHYLEQRSRAEELRRPGQTGMSREEIEGDIETVGVINVLKILGVLAIGTFIIAAALFDWAIVGIVAASGFLLAVLITLPYLPLFFTESERDELSNLKHEHRANP